MAHFSTQEAVSLSGSVSRQTKKTNRVSQKAQNWGFFAAFLSNFLANDGAKSFMSAL